MGNCVCIQNCLTDDLTQAEFDTRRGKSPVTVSNGKQSYSREEVAEHASASSAWVALHGKVYDMTKLIASHPGGRDAILNLAGQDGSHAFDSMHAYHISKMGPYCIGILSRTSEGGSSGSSSRALTSMNTSSLMGAGSMLDMVIENESSAPPALAAPGQKISLPLQSKTIISHDTVLLRFQLPSAEHRLGLHTGGHIMMYGTAPDGTEVVRAYTPTTLDCDLGIMDLLIKVYRPTPDFPAGGKMGAIVDALQVGQSMRFSGPFGRFQYHARGRYTIGTRPPADGAPAALITCLAGGSGITPVYQVIRAVMEYPSDSTLISLIYANRTEQDILLKPQLDEMATRYAGRFKVLYVLSTAPPGWTGETGLVNTAMMSNHAFMGGAGVLGLVCGPPGFVEYAAKPGLKALGYDDAHTIIF